MEKTDMGLIGLGVMGRNIALNLIDNGMRLALYNRTIAKTYLFIEQHEKQKAGMVACDSIEQFIDKLDRPRKIFLMLPAGDAVTAVIERLLPLLSAGDLLIDGGNSFFRDSDERRRRLRKNGMEFIGLGVSGGEQGARFGPSLMAGGSRRGWDVVKNIFEKISAKAAGQPCCAWLGEGGAGHFVKMIHNGIEYAEMQLIAECWDFLSRGRQLTASQAAEIFNDWNNADLASYLLEITVKILQVEEKGKPLIDLIRDAAANNGTGRWSVLSAMELDAPAPAAAAAFFARLISGLTEQRKKVSNRYRQPSGSVRPRLSTEKTVNRLKNAYLAARIALYSEAFATFKQAAGLFEAPLPADVIAAIWRNGCIIRSAFLDRISAACRADRQPVDLLLEPWFAGRIDHAAADWRRSVAAAITAGLPMPVFSATLAYFDSYRSPRLPANLLQAQRDYFGAHRFQRLDRDSGESFHYQWAK